MIKKHSLLTLLLCTATHLHAQVGIITTIAGVGFPGDLGDGIPATAALLDKPNSLLLGPANNLFIVDCYNHVIKRMDLSTGIMNYVTMGGQGYNGDNIPASTAKLYVPQGICADAAGNIYIADGLNARVRRIDAVTGIITTVAGNGTSGYNGGDGGPATDAAINTPLGVCCSGNNLYICDYDNNLLRKVNLTTGIITYVAGNGYAGYSGDGGAATDAKLNGPAGVACDNEGNLFIADHKNAAIRRIDAATGKISTIGGTGVPGYAGDGGPATDAKFREPLSIFLDKHNKLYIADFTNGAIRKIDLGAGIITTVVGGSYGYGGDGGPATDAKLTSTDAIVDDAGNIYIADYLSHRIRMVSSALKVSNYPFHEFALAVHPNPTNGKFEVQCPAGGNRITVADMTGRVVYQSAVVASRTGIDITGQPSGIYMVYIQSGEDRYISKVLLQN